MLGGCAFSDPVSRDYSVTPCPRGGIQIAYFGQSNSANSVTPKSSAPPPSNLFQYNWKSGRCYRYREPLLGADGFGGNTITPAAIDLATKYPGPVTIIPFGVSRTSVLQWAFGHLAIQQHVALAQIRKSGLSPTIVLWHQGETDAKLHRLLLRILTTFPHTTQWKSLLISLGQHAYNHGLQTVINRSRNYFPRSHFGIALATRCQNDLWPPIRQAQIEAAGNNQRAFISADSDRIFGSSLRYDGCHFSNSGAKALSQEYVAAITRIFNLAQQHSRP